MFRYVLLTMPWQTADKPTILKFLGYPATDHSLKMIGDRMVAIEALDALFVDQAQDYIAQLKSLESDIKDATSNLTAGANVSFNADDNPVEYRPGEPLLTLRQEGTRYTVLLAELLGLVVYRNWFEIPVNARSTAIKRS